MAVATPITEDANTTAANISTIGSTPQMQAAQTAPAAQATADTVQSELAGILNRGGPLMQQARTQAAQAVNQRGLLNSSMGIQAGEAAMLQAAVPIATSDANLKTGVSQSNTSALNQNAQYNASNTQQSNQVNAANQQQTNLANQSAANQGAQFNAQQANAQSQYNAGQQNEAMLKTMDVNSREQLAGIEADYKQIMQVNSSAGTLYEQAMKNISDIQTNKDIGDKQTAINSQLAWLRSGMQMIQNLNGVSGLVTF